MDTEVIQLRKHPAADFLGLVGGRAIDAEKVFREAVGRAPLPG
ncbi:MAG TPA: hypothetical protein VMU34_25670 [Mycobacterium sp.]|nr:hypothetical protein [Mycobacterium sp.]